MRDLVRRGVDQDEFLPRTDLEIRAEEVVLVDKETGDMFTGREAFTLVGGGGSGRVRPADLEQWRVFVQSTSYNRALVAGTGFLYEVDTDF